MAVFSHQSVTVLPQQPCLLHRTLRGRYATLQPQHRSLLPFPVTLLGWDVCMHPLHVLTSLCVSPLLNLTAVLTQLKTLRLDSSQHALGPVLEITWFLFNLLHLSAAFHRANHLLLLQTFSSSALLLYIVSLMAPSQSFLAGCFSADWFLSAGVSQGSNLG